MTRNGLAVQDLGLRVKAGEGYAVGVPPPEPAEPEPQAMALAIVYEDRDIIVIDKPKGLAVHPGPGHASGTLVNALIAHCGASLSGIGGVRRPGIVHRLDKDTTGLLVVAKTDRAHQGLAEQFAAHGADGRLRRGYRAIAWGAPERPRGSHRGAARAQRRQPHQDRRRAGGSASGRRAVTHYEVLERFGSGRRRRSRSPACCASCWRPAAPTRSACTSPTSATRCSATRPTGPATRRARASSTPRRRRRSPRSAARPCMRRSWRSCTP